MLGFNFRRRNTVANGYDYHGLIKKLCTPSLRVVEDIYTTIEINGQAERHRCDSPMDGANSLVKLGKQAHLSDYTIMPGSNYKLEIDGRNFYSFELRNLNTKPPKKGYLKIEFTGELPRDKS